MPVRRKRPQSPFERFRLQVAILFVGMAVSAVFVFAAMYFMQPS